MALLPIIIAPDPRLKVVSEPVEAFDEALRGLIEGMLEAMYEAPGVGLSAVQVGVPRRLIVLDTAREEAAAEPYVLINPEIVRYSEQAALYNEGCLSFPEFFFEMERPENCTVDYLDRDGVKRSLEADGLLARCVQHEYDHLDGTLFVDHMSALKRNIILRKLVKTRKQKASA